MDIGLVSIGEMAVILGVAIVTLRRWDRNGQFCPKIRTIGGHRRYDPTASLLNVDCPEDNGATILYARVSSHDQKDDLVRQGGRLKAYAESQGWTNINIISDLGSGMNYRKKGLLTLLSRILSGNVRRLVIENKDRLLRFGADLLIEICKSKGIAVIVVDKPAQESFEKVLISDMLEILTVFSARMYGARSGRRKRVA